MFTTVGTRHVCMWDWKDGSKKKGIGAGEYSTMSHCVVACDDDGCSFTGASNGMLFKWEGRDFGCAKPAHKGYLSAVRCVGGKVITGGKDGVVKVWSPHDLEVQKEMNCFNGSMIRAIDCCQQTNNMLVGTRCGTIRFFAGGDEGNCKEIMHSHNDGEVWGLDKFDDNCVVTSGDDNQVIIWDVEQRRRMKVHGVSTQSKNSKKGGASTLSHSPASQCSRCVVKGPSGLIVAGNDGTVHVHDDASGASTKLCDSSEWIECMTMSPCGRFLAVGSHDNNIYIYDSQNNWGKVGCANKHSSYIMALDWSCDGKWMRSNSGDYELLFWTVGEDGCIAQDPSGASNTTSVAFASQTVKFSWHVEGVYPRGTDGTHINRVNGSPCGGLLVTGDDWCNVRIFRNPCRKGNNPRTYRGHSEFVTNCIFNGNRIFSVGGYDQTLMQWK